MPLLQEFLALVTTEQKRFIGKAVLLLFGVAVVWFLVPERTISQPEGVLAPDAPTRAAVKASVPISYKGYTLTLMEKYELKARILAKENYLPVEKEASLAPIDMVLGTGIMSNSAVIKFMSFSISNRVYHAHADSGLNVDWAMFDPYLDNNHLIPATAPVRKAMKAARTGNVIHLKGYLVEATKPNSAYRWASSFAEGSSGTSFMTCKLIYVTEFSVVK